jgi:hypothetical protein
VPTVEQEAEEYSDKRRRDGNDATSLLGEKHAGVLFVPYLANTQRIRTNASAMDGDKKAPSNSGDVQSAPHFARIFSPVSEAVRKRAAPFYEGKTSHFPSSGYPWMDGEKDTPIYVRA